MERIDHQGESFYWGSRLDSIPVNKIVRQYTAVVGALDNLFLEMDLRSDMGLWRINGVGTCRNLNEEGARQGLGGPAKDTLILLRTRRAKDNPGLSRLTACPYHREGCGCILKELKSPLCIAAVENKDEVWNRFKIKGQDLEDDIEWMLEGVLYQGVPPGTKHFNPNMPTSEFVLEALDAICQMTKYVKAFPVIH